MTKLECGVILLTLTSRWDALPPEKQNYLRNERHSRWTPQPVCTVLKNKYLMTPMGMKS